MYTDTNITTHNEVKGINSNKKCINVQVMHTDANTNTNGSVILYTNADCLTNKLNELKILIKSFTFKPAIIANTEDKPKHRWHFNINELQLQGYSMFKNDLDSSYTSGVVIYVDERLEATEINIETKFSESIFIKIKSGFIIGNIYRSPSSSQDNDNALCDLIESVSKKISNFILVGDFNFNDIDWYHWCSLQNKASSCQFLNVLRDNLSLQHMVFPPGREEWITRMS